MRPIIPAGIQFIKDHEGLRLTAYYCPAGVLTIGWGHTGADVKPGLKISRARAEQLLAQDLATFGTGVAGKLRREANDNEFAAMVSLAFNIGAPAFAGSTVLKRFNAGDRDGAAAAFLMWKKMRDPATRRLVDDDGLEKRRIAERALFLTPAHGPVPAAPLRIVEDLADVPAMPQAVEGERQRPSNGAIGGSTAAATGTGAMGIDQLQGVLESTKSELWGLAQYLPYAKWGLLALTFAGLAFLCYGLIKRWRKGGG